MPKLLVTNRDGNTKTIDAESGITLMENIRDNGFDELLALCGGSCSCATCHIYVDDEWLSKIGPVDGDEDELLSSSDHLESNSRLSCQIEMSDELDGISVTLAPED